jgi:hypothetical protein
LIELPINDNLLPRVRDGSKRAVVIPDRAAPLGETLRLHPASRGIPGRAAPSVVQDGPANPTPVDTLVNESARMRVLHLDDEVAQSAGFADRTALIASLSATYGPLESWELIKILYIERVPE